MEQGVWQEIELLYQKFQKLGISEAVDYDKYYLYSLITHSTAIEGSTLTELDTQLLFDEGVTAKGKPLVHHLMNEDLKQAYELAKVESDSLVPITPAFLKRMNAMLMRTTGSVHSVMGGSFDSSKGEFRLCGVTAGVGGHSYMNYLKVPAKVDELCAILQEKQKKMGTFREQYELSFNAHLNLVTIHPWVDGNGRTARLLMNYIQFCYLGPEPGDIPDPMDIMEGPHVAEQVRLPMRPSLRSLNLTNCASIAIYEAWRQMGFKGGA